MEQDPIEREFIAAHLYAHPEREAISELLKAKVPLSRILSLYPYNLSEWTPAIIKSLGSPSSLRGEGTPDVSERLAGIEYNLNSLPRARHFWRKQIHAQAKEVLYTPANEALLWSTGIWEISTWGARTKETAFYAAVEVIAIASQWRSMSELMPYRSACLQLTKASLAALLPTAFRMDFPPAVPHR